VVRKPKFFCVKDTNPLTRSAQDADGQNFGWGQNFASPSENLPKKNHFQKCGFFD
jgi:hypothetical protein